MSKERGAESFLLAAPSVTILVYYLHHRCLRRLVFLSVPFSKFPDPYECLGGCVIPCTRALLNSWLIVRVWGNVSPMHPTSFIVVSTVRKAQDRPMLYK